MLNTVSDAPGLSLGSRREWLLTVLIPRSDEANCDEVVNVSKISAKCDLTDTDEHRYLASSLDEHSLTTTDFGDTKKHQHATDPDKRHESAPAYSTRHRRERKDYRRLP